jgi:hypothetical protein
MIILFCNMHDFNGDFTPETKRKLLLLEQASRLLVVLRDFAASPACWGVGYRYLRVMGTVNRAHKRYMRRLKAIK